MIVDDLLRKCGQGTYDYVSKRPCHLNPTENTPNCKNKSYHEAFKRITGSNQYLSA